MTTIDKAIKEKGLKKKWVAEQAGIAPYTLSKIISGESVPTLPTALKIASVPGVSVEDLWGYIIEWMNEMITYQIILSDGSVEKGKEFEYDEVTYVVKEILKVEHKEGKTIVTCDLDDS